MPLLKRGHAPSSMRRLTHSSVPYQATIFSAAVLLITVVLNYVMPEAVFVMITSISTFCFIFIWAMMVICHLKYRKKNPELAAQSKFKMPLYPVMNYVILGFFVFRSSYSSAKRRHANRPLVHTNLVRYPLGLLLHA